MDAWFSDVVTQLGYLRVVWSVRGVREAHLADQVRALPTPPEGASEGPTGHPWVRTIEALANGESVVTHVPLDVEGTALQRAVWDVLQGIPRGETRTYAQIAAAVGQSPGAARAIGQACGANRVALLIPCHRAVRSDGGLGGFRWGLGRKQLLLSIETGAGLLIP